MNKNEKLIYSAIEDRKGVNIKFYDVRDKNPMCDAIFICTALNERNLHAIQDSIEETAELNNMTVKHIEGRHGSNWILIDLNDIVVHIFTEEERNRINLDLLLDNK